MIDEVIKSLLINNPFYGIFLSHIDREYSETIPTAAFDYKEMKLLVNRSFFERLSDTEKKAVLEHEVLHCAFEHGERFAHIKNEQNAFLINVACDVAINQLIDGLPDGGITIDVFRNLLSDNDINIDIEEKQNAEYYYNLLKQIKNDCNNNTGISEQELNEQHKHMEGKPSPAQTEKIRKLLEHAKNEAKKRGNGAGGELLDILPDYSAKVHKHIWQKLVTKLMGEELSDNVTSFYGKPNRRYSDSFYYKKHDLINNTIYIGIDTSASISNDDLSKFIGYVKNGAKKNNVNCIVIQCDYEIQSVEKLSLYKQKPFTVKGRGGTDLTKILDYIEEKEKNNLKNTRLILLTDGETTWRQSEIKTSVVYNNKNYSEITPIYNSAVLE